MTTPMIATLIITNFHLYLIQLWSQFFHIFVYGDVVYAQTWEVLTRKNCIEPPYANDLTFSLASVQPLAAFEVVAFKVERVGMQDLRNAGYWVEQLFAIIYWLKAFNLTYK